MRQHIYIAFIFVWTNICGAFFKLLLRLDQPEASKVFLCLCFKDLVAFSMNELNDGNSCVTIRVVFFFTQKVYRDRENAGHGEVRNQKGLTEGTRQKTNAIN